MMIQIAALALLLIFYGGYFGKMLRQRRQGIQTDQIGRSKVKSTRRIERVMKAATVAVPVAEVACIACGISRLPIGARCAGLGIALCGDLVFLCSVAVMRDSWRAGVCESDRRPLVTDGIYRFSRNPAFLGFDLVYLGIVLAFFHWALAALSVFAAAMFHLQIVKVEEPFLSAAFGTDYENYRKTVNRYLGRKPMRRKQKSNQGKL